MEELRARLRERGAVQITVKVVPRSSRTEAVGKLREDVYKIRVAAPPAKGKANAALCEFLARDLGVPKGNVTIESGHASTLKRVRITAPGRRPEGG